MKMELGEDGYYHVVLKELDVPSPYNGKIYSSKQLAEVFKSDFFQRQMNYGLPISIGGQSNDVRLDDMVGVVRMIQMVKEDDRTLLVGHVKLTGLHSKLLEEATEPCFGMRCLTSGVRDNGELKIEQLLGFNLISSPPGDNNGIEG